MSDWKAAVIVGLIAFLGGCILTLQASVKVWDTDLARGVVCPNGAGPCYRLIPIKFEDRP
jgi:hypothetical protein